MEGSVLSPVLKRGLMFAQSQSLGREQVRRDWEKRFWRIGARMSEQCFRMYAGMLSGPVAFVWSSFSSSFWIPFVVMSRLGIVGYGEGGMSGG